MRALTGATLWARKTLESDIFFSKPDKWFKIWFFLVQIANHTDGKQILRGECLTSYPEIIEATGAKRDQVDGFLRWAKRTTAITTRKTTRGMIIKLLKFDKYQDLENYKTDTKNDSKTEVKPKRNRNETDMIQENDNNDNNEKNELLVSTPAKETRDFFSNLDLQEQTVLGLVERGVSEQAARIEIDKFVSYWTELNPSGTKQRWQMEKTFEIQRRLATWFRNVRNFNKQVETKGITL